MAVLTVLDLRGDRRDPTDRLPRGAVDLASVRTAVEEILAEVRTRGDDAVRDLTERFDQVRPDQFAVDPHLLRASLQGMPGDVRAALERAAAQIRWFHQQARPADWTAERGGARLGQRFRPLQRVGVYVPGGQAAYPSSVLMAVVPAQVAGVDEIVLCTPPTGNDGRPDRTILAAAAMLGVDRVFGIGGAQAVAAMAYGTTTVLRCDKIVGPGNLYVALAKQLVQAEGRCGVEGFAGPTEIAIIADASADPRLLAADLVAQAEHDELASCLLVTPDPALVEAVADALQREVAIARHRQRVETALAGQGVAVIVDDLAPAGEGGGGWR